jgi:hypothetical protein
MFQRRNPRPLLQRIRAALVPAGGYRRAAVYLAHRVGRLPGTPYRVAAGFACGAAVSVTPFIGFHFVLAMLASLVLRGNVIASAVGTVVGNPWTFPFIWAWTYGFGRWLLGRRETLELPQFDFAISHIFERLETIFWPMLLGSLPTAVVVWVVFFFPVHSAVAQYQRARRGRLRKRARKLRIARVKQSVAAPSASPTSVPE